VPVIGLVQVGAQALADRYTYIPLIGLFLAVSWLVAERLAAWRVGRFLLAAGASAVVLTCAALTRIQAGYWKDSRTLFQHALRVTTGNAMAHACLGTALVNQERFADALNEFSCALTLRPAFAKPLASMAQVLSAQGRSDVAAACYATAGDALVRSHSTRDAIPLFQQALRLRPDWPEVLNNFAWLLATHPDAAVRSGAQAVPMAERACQLTGGTNRWFLATLAAAYAEAGRFPDAVSTQQKACDLPVAQGQDLQADSLRQRVKLFRSGNAFRQP
jgi:protein O-mannosyl-transferase